MELPKEMWYQILFYSDISDLCSHSQINKCTSYVSRDNIFWSDKYLKDLGETYHCPIDWKWNYKVDYYANNPYRNNYNLDFYIDDYEF